jgi:phage-related holin
MSDKMKKIYEEIPLNAVIDYYLKAFKDTPTEKIFSREYFIDVTKNVVIFKLYIEVVEK